MATGRLPTGKMGAGELGNEAIEGEPFSAAVHFLVRHFPVIPSKE
jgi:hypothetical protein